MTWIDVRAFDVANRQPLRFHELFSGGAALGPLRPSGGRALWRGKMAAPPSRRSGVSAHSCDDPCRVSAARLETQLRRRWVGARYCGLRSLTPISRPRLSPPSLNRTVGFAVDRASFDSSNSSSRSAQQLSALADIAHASTPAPLPHWPSHRDRPARQLLLFWCPLRPSPADQCATVRQSSP